MSVADFKGFPAPHHRRVGPAVLNEAFPPGVAAGNRYPDSQLVHMDSEKAAG